MTQTNKSEKMSQIDNANLFKQDCFVASSMFLYSEYVLRHIHFTYYDNLFLMDDSLKKLEPCIFDIFIILSFMDYVREDIEKEYEMQASIVNFMKCFLHSKIENLKNNEKIIKKYGIENINESTIYKFYKNSIDDEQEQHIRTLALCSSMFGVFANRVFTFRNKDYTKIKYHPKSILENR